MFAGKENIDIPVCISRQDLADLTQGFSRDDYLFSRISIFQMDAAQGDTQSIRGYHLQDIFIDLEQFACEDLICDVVRDGKDRLPDDFLQCKLRHTDRF